MWRKGDGWERRCEEGKERNRERRITHTHTHTRKMIMRELGPGTIAFLSHINGIKKCLERELSFQRQPKI